MDKTTTGNMKEEAVFQFQLQKEQVRYDAPVMLQAIQAYAELCKAEALERIADQLGSTFKMMNFADYEALINDANNRGDQSIADAISERPILCLDCKERIPSAGVYAFNDPNEGQVIPLCGSCGRKRDKESIADAINEQVTDPPDEPWSTLPQRTYKDGISFVCFCNVGYASKAEADECTIRHAAVPPDEPFKPIRALCIGCDMLYPIEDLTTRSTGRFCTTCYYLEAV